MKILIVATSHKPKKFFEELKARERYRIEYLEICDRLPASYMDYDAPWMHHHRQIRRLEEKIHIDFFWAHQIAQKVKRENFDVVISMSERVAIPLGLMLDPQVKHIARLLSAMSTNWLFLIKRLKLQQRWSHIITCSQAEVEALQAHLAIGPDKISCILDCVDVDFFTPNGIVANPDEKPCILSHGLSKRDYPTLIRAMQKLPHVTCQISAVSAWDKFKAGYEGMDIPPNVQLKSFNHPSLIRNVLAQSRFLVIPLRPQTGMWTAGCTSVLQAQAMGRPVIVTDLPGIAEYVKDGKTGILVKGNDSDNMAEAIDALWKDPGRAMEMGNTAKQWVHENFALENLLNRFGSLLHNSS